MSNKFIERQMIYKNKSGMVIYKVNLWTPERRLADHKVFKKKPAG
jgi:ribosomal protein L15E